MAEVHDEPPPVMLALRRAVTDLYTGRSGVVVEHNFLDDEEGSFGWNTILSPAGAGWRIWFWLDGVDEDLMLMVDDEYHFEWLDLTDEQAVVADVLGICSAVLAGDLRIRRKGRWR